MCIAACSAGNSVPLHGVTYAAAAPAVAYSSAPSVSTVYNSVNAAPLAKHVTYSSPAVGSSAQSVERSFDGTVSQYAKAVDTAFSTVRKQDTRVTNNVYSQTPVLATRTLSYAAPAAAQAYVHAAPAHSYGYAAPQTYVHSAPAQLVHSAPAQAYVHSAPAQAYLHSAPAPLVHAGPHQTYVQAAHSPSVVHASRAVSYSSAPVVAHVSFDGLGAHYAW